MSVAVLTSVCSNAYGIVEGLAVIWGSVMIFDLVVVVLTLARTMKIKRRSGKGHTLTHILMRDGRRHLVNRFWLKFSSSSRCRIFRVYPLPHIEAIGGAQNAAQSYQPCDIV